MSHVRNYNLSSEVYQKDEGIFVLDKNEISKFNEDELNFIKPMYKNSDIQKWKTDIKNSKWILITNDIDNIDDYPNIKKHLMKYKQILDGRYRNFALKNADKEGKWWYLYGYRPNTNFDGEKIVNANRSVSNIFTYSNEPFYATMDLFYTIIKCPSEYNPKYILSILNSKLIKYWMESNCKRKGAMYELISEPLSKIPIKSASKSTQNDLVFLVDELLKSSKSDDYYHQVQSEINNKIYNLYGLATNEIDFIENETKEA